MMEAEIVAGERAVTVGVVRTGAALKSAWRAQMTGAGLGRRLANAIRPGVPEVGGVELRRRWCSAALPEIIDAIAAAC